MKKYEFLEHPAELKARSFGKDLSELFVSSALAMMDYIYGNITKTKITRTDDISIAAEDLESLLIDWLAEILYLSDAHNRAYLDYHIENLDEHKIIAQIGSIEAQPVDEIKAVTFHELDIKKQNDVWQATVVYDI